MNETIRLLPVAIMAHNEELFICRAVNSCLSQVCPPGFSILVVVVANGCTDRTEECVEELRTRFPDNIVLISTEEKGKTKALNRAIAHLRDLGERNDIPFVTFLDADCQLVGDQTLIKFIRDFENNPMLGAIAAQPVPRSDDSTSCIVSQMYRALNELSRLLPENGISGTCYSISMDVLRKLAFPDFQMADDMYVSLKLDGRMLRDRDIHVAHSIPRNLWGEFRKRRRQEIATVMFMKYFQSLKGAGNRIALFDAPLDDRFRWSGFSGSQAFRAWTRLKGNRYRLLIGMNAMIRALAKIAARSSLRRIERDTTIDFWKIAR